MDRSRLVLMTRCGHECEMNLLEIGGGAKLFVRSAKTSSKLGANRLMVLRSRIHPDGYANEFIRTAETTRQRMLLPNGDRLAEMCEWTFRLLINIGKQKLHTVLVLSVGQVLHVKLRFFFVDIAAFRRGFEHPRRAGAIFVGEKNFLRRNDVEADQVVAASLGFGIENAESISMMSPKSSKRMGFGCAGEKISRIPPRKAKVPTSSTIGTLA